MVHIEYGKKSIIPQWWNIIYPWLWWEWQIQNNMMHWKTLEYDEYKYGPHLGITPLWKIIYPWLWMGWQIHNNMMKNNEIRWILLKQCYSSVEYHLSMVVVGMAKENRWSDALATMAMLARGEKKCHKHQTRDKYKDKDKYDKNKNRW